MSGWRISKSWKVGPLRLTASRRGLSVSTSLRAPKRKATT